MSTYIRLTFVLIKMWDTPRKPRNAPLKYGAADPSHSPFVNASRPPGLPGMRALYRLLVYLAQIVVYQEVMYPTYIPCHANTNTNTN